MAYRLLYQLPSLGTDTSLRILLPSMGPAEHAEILVQVGLGTLFSLGDFVIPPDRKNTYRHTITYEDLFGIEGDERVEALRRHLRTHMPNLN